MHCTCLQRCGSASHYFTFDEMRLLKEGMANPFAALVASLKQQLQGTVTEA